MAKKGGYQIIDLKNESFTLGSEKTIAGVYDLLEGSYGKAIMLSGLNVAGTEIADTFAQPILSGTSFVLVAHGYKVTVADDDGITVAKNSAAEAAGTAPTKAEFKAVIDALVAAGIVLN